jgi:tetratricopeptide (TPR) repeat protein
MERFLGLHREGQQAVAVAAAEAARPLVAPPPAVRKSNEAARERAETFIQRGDLLFGEGQFQPALQRYKSATEAAPDLATPYIRQGIALAATNRFDLAAKAFKIGASLAPDIRFDGFELDMIYGPGKEFTKKLHFEDVARAGLDQPENGNIMFVLGVLLFYDGQIDRSEKFFRRAADLDSTLNDTVRRFTGEPIKGEVRT